MSKTEEKCKSVCQGLNPYNYLLTASRKCPAERTKVFSSVDWYLQHGVLPDVWEETRSARDTSIESMLCFDYNKFHTHIRSRRTPRAIILVAVGAMRRGSTHQMHAFLLRRDSPHLTGIRNYFAILLGGGGGWRSERPTSSAATVAYSQKPWRAESRECRRHCETECANFAGSWGCGARLRHF